MKALKPSAKEHKRYLLLKGNNLKKNVPEAILDFIGKLGMSKCGLSWIKSNIICINREMVDSVRASLCAWPEKIDVLKVSGSVKGLSSK